MFTQRVEELRALVEEQRINALRIKALKDSLVSDMCKANVRDIPVGLGMFRLVWDMPSEVKKANTQQYPDFKSLMKPGSYYGLSQIIALAGKKQAGAKFKKYVQRLVDDGELKTADGYYMRAA